MGPSLAKLLDCEAAADPLAAMREKSSAEVLAAAGNDPAQSRTRAIVDGWVFPDEISTIYAQARQHHVPVIVGSNADEGTSLAAPIAVPTSVDSFTTATKKKFGELAERAAKVYPVTSDSDVRDAYLHSFRDEWFTWEMRTWARMMQKASDKAYVYYFSRVPPRPEAQQYGAYHAAEIVYVFDNLARLPWKSEPADQALAEAMSAAWVRFAATGDPNGGNLASWPNYDPRQEKYLEFGNQISGGNALLKAECDLVDDYMAVKRNELAKKQ